MAALGPIAVPRSELDPWYFKNLVCPVDHSALRQDGHFLLSEGGRRYPVVQGIPVMLRGDVKETIGIERISLDEAIRTADGEGDGEDPMYLQTLGISEHERKLARQLLAGGAQFDPIVSVIVGATSGFAYKHLIGQDLPYSIPAFRFPGPGAGLLLDIGCNWGRWTLSAAQAGYSVVGIDPSLGAILAARRVAEQLGLRARFIVGDARYLPFRNDLFDSAWSYSVLQHFSREDATLALVEVARTLHSGGIVRIQMANALGIRSFYHMARRRFRPPADFDVRYWWPSELVETYSRAIGPTSINADCFLGLGLQWSDFRNISPVGKGVLIVSEALRRLSAVVYPLRWFADSLFCTSRVSSGVNHSY